MNIPLLIAGIATLVIGGVHTALGEATIIRPLLAGTTRPPLDSEGGRRVVRFAWHITTVGFWGLAALFLVNTGGDLDSGSRTALRIAAITFWVISTMVIAGVGIRAFQWPIFAMVGATVWLGTL